MKSNSTSIPVVWRRAGSYADHKPFGLQILEGVLLLLVSQLEMLLLQ
jgi:hypothetical protein